MFLQHYERAEDATKAVEKLDDTDFMGVHIQVQVPKLISIKTAFKIFYLLSCL